MPSRNTLDKRRTNWNTRVQKSLNNPKQKIRIGAIYGTQENVTPNKELKLL